ncbi:MAG: RagB/SusD family nutrient uptake outer membrane protein [Bacteroidota bacterium]
MFQPAALGLAIGDTAIYIAPTDAIATALKSLTGADKKKYWIVSPSEYYTNQAGAIQVYPNLKKYDDSKRSNFNDVSGRPFIVSKFSEAYLLAAEAALGDNRPADAVPLLNTVRERAAYRPGLSAGELAAAELLWILLLHR